MEYKRQAPGCENECGNPDAVSLCTEPDVFDSCVCKPGFLRSGESCVKEEQCGCLDMDTAAYYKVINPHISWRAQHQKY